MDEMKRLLGCVLGAMSSSLSTATSYWLTLDCLSHIFRSPGFFIIKMM